MTQAPGTGAVLNFTVGDRLRKAREFAGLDQAALAADIEVSRQTITNYELGHVAQRRITVRQWALRCGVSFDWIWTGNVFAPSPDGPERWAPRGSNPQPTDYKSAVSDADLVVVPLHRAVVLPLRRAAA